MDETYDLAHDDWTDLLAVDEGDAVRSVSRSHRIHRFDTYERLKPSGARYSLVSVSVFCTTAARDSEARRGTKETRVETRIIKE